MAVNLQFTVNPYDVAYSILIKGKSKQLLREAPGHEEIALFRESARAKDKDPIRDLFICAERGESMMEYLEALTELPVFHVLLSQTYAALERVQAEWEAELTTSLAHMTDILGFEPSGDWPVSITHPAVRQGSNNGQSIYWTHRTDWPFYNVVYLWHETLHFLFGHTDLEHAVIELATDFELRKRFSGTEYKNATGHHFLDPLRACLDVAWQEYLRSANHNIYEFVSRYLVDCSRS